MQVRVTPDRLPVYPVFDHVGLELGEAASFGEARRMHRKHYEGSEKFNTYAGIDCSPDSMSRGFYPIFNKQQEI